MYFVCMHHYMRTNYLLLGTVGWRPNPLYLNKAIILLFMSIHCISLPFGNKKPTTHSVI